MTTKLDVLKALAGHLESSMIGREALTEIIELIEALDRATTEMNETGTISGGTWGELNFHQERFLVLQPEKLWPL
jgi:hypothetical protein